MQRHEIIFLNSAFFVLGFTLTFSVVGVLFQTILVHAPHSVMSALINVGGILIIGFGVLLLASSKYIVPFFSTEHKLIHVKRFSNTYISSFVFGVAFALGWTPCVGAILGSIYIFAASQPGLSFLLLMTYSLGMGIPFLIIGAFISKLEGFMKKIRGLLLYFNIIGGLFLIIMGLLVVTGYIGELSVLLLSSPLPASPDTQISFLFALIAGFLTFISPCMLPVLPAFLSYMAGTSAETVKK